MLAVMAGVAALAAAGDVFSWKGGASVRSFGNPAYWAPGEHDSDISTATNPDNLVPGPSDSIFYNLGAVYKKFYFDLDNTSYTVKDFSNFSYNWYVHDMSVENGTLMFGGSFSNRYITAVIKDTGKLVVGDRAVSRLGESGARCSLTIKSGGEVDLGGTISIDNFVVTVEDGGTFVCDTEEARFDPNNSNNADSKVGQGIFNYGYTEFPYGFTLGGSGHTSYPNQPPEFTIKQNDGTMVLGGPVERPVDLPRGRLMFELNGGTLAASADVSFIGLYSCTMTSNATVTVDVTMGQTLDFSGMAFGSDTTIEKTGRGTVMFGATVPDVVSVEAGIVSFTDSVTLGTLTLVPGTSVVLAHSGITLTSVTGYEDANFSVDEDVLGLSVPLLSSPDATFLAAVAAKLDMPAGCVAEVSDGTLTIYQDESAQNVFTSIGEVPLDILENWNQETVPVGEDVIVSGASTIAMFDQFVPDFNSITVMNGATLKVYGTPTNLPPITLQYDAHLIFAAEASVTMPPIAGYATAAMLPTVEIATNATVVVEDDTYRMTNVHLRLFGTLDVKQDFDFGWADTGSTTFFNLTADGATITNRTNVSYLRFLCPAAGGTVQAPEKMTFRHTVFRPLTASPSRFRTWVGYGNSVDAPFTLEVDDCFLELRGNGAMYIGGAATIACVNGGGVKKTEQFGHPGLYMNLYIQDRAKLTFDDESYFLYTFNRYPIHVEPAEDGYETFVFRGNSRIGVHMLTGNGKAIATFENSWWDVLQLSDFSSGVVTGATDSRGWMTNAFHGLKVVNVPSGKFVGVRSEDYWPWGIDWNREILLDPDVPIIGGGSLFVTNASPGWSMRAIVACGANTATGEARAYPSADGCQLLFADGANWAGTVVGDENVAFTNRTSGAAPASVTFGAIRFAGNLPVRVWRTGANPASDYLRINGALSGTGGFAPMTMDGAPEPGDTYTIGEIPLVGGSAPNVSAYSVRGWKLSAVPSGNGETALLRIRCAPDGTQLFFR